MDRIRSCLPWLGGALGFALLLTLIDHQGAPVAALGGYLVLTAVGASLLALGWRSTVDARTPRAVGISLLVAVLLRMAIGVGLQKGLPVYGYDTKPQSGGYVYYDAYARDTDAWARGRSDRSLFSAFEERKASDQYGGLLFVSAGIYRYLSDGHHRPLMLVVLAAAVSSLAVLFSWGFVGMTFGTRAGVVAAWILALYPDYVLLGASQMREAFIVPAMALALLGYARFRLGRYRNALMLAGLGLLLALVISPPYAFMTVLLMGGLGVVEGRLSWKRTLIGLVGILILAAVAVALTAEAWTGLQGLPNEGRIGLFVEWLTRGADVQLAHLEEQSGWAQKLFAATPDWSHLPLATVYGMTRPFLPAALGVNVGAPIWRAIAVWRSLGWFLLAPALMYSSGAALTAKKHRGSLLMLTAVIWLGVFTASYRAAGDMWDNPRYRVGLLVLQAGLVGWGWLTAQRRESPWLRRAYLLVFGSGLIFLHWYLGRYYGTPRLSLEWTLVAIGGFGFLILFVGWLLDHRERV